MGYSPPYARFNFISFHFIFRGGIGILQMIDPFIQKATINVYADYKVSRYSEEEIEEGIPTITDKLYLNTNNVRRLVLTNDALVIAKRIGVNIDGMIFAEDQIQGKEKKKEFMNEKFTSVSE